MVRIICLNQRTTKLHKLIRLCEIIRRILRDTVKAILSFPHDSVASWFLLQGTVVNPNSL